MRPAGCVSVKPGLPATVDFGLMPKMTGTGLLIAKTAGFDPVAPLKT
jgi:hypothetical protein